jgi:hypothetical protein
MATKSVATKEDAPTDVAVFDASMFENDAGQGMDNMGQEDLALPFLKILSGLDPILDEREDARKGDIYNTVTGRSTRASPDRHPCAYQRRFIRWAPRGTGTGAPVAIYTPADSRPSTERSKDDNRDYVQDGSGNYIDENAPAFCRCFERRRLC